MLSYIQRIGIIIHLKLNFTPSIQIINMNSG